MSTGADNRTMPITPEYAEGYERTFGDRSPERGKWIWSDVQKKLVPLGEYVPPPRALDAPIMVDRFYEGAKATDGTDIGSRRKHREYMHANNLTTADDFTETWKKAEQRRAAERADPSVDAGNRERREQIGRAAYAVEHGYKPHIHDGGSLE